MLFRCVSSVVLALSIVSRVSTPALAQVPFTWAQIKSSTNRVSLTSVAGTIRPGTEMSHLVPGDTLSTSASSQVELLFNDGSLARIGEQASFRFWPTTRKLRLDQGTALLFVPPEQGRTLIQTPNALAGLQNTAVVVRYVPARNLTLVMALADSAAGPISITVASETQESVLYAGQMAFIDNTGVQIVEFDLLEFYQTSDLIHGLNLSDLNYQALSGDPIAALRPSLIAALYQQRSFAGTGSVLDPALIRNPTPTPSLFGVRDDSILPTDLPHQAGGLREYDQAPAGVVTPLPDMLEPVSPRGNEPLGSPINATGEAGVSSGSEPATVLSPAGEANPSGEIAEPK